MGHARALIGLEKAKDQIELAKRILTEGLNVRQTEDLIRNWKAGPKRTGSAAAESAKPDPNVKAAQQKLQEYLGTKVVIGSSTIQVHYRDAEDLIRIYELLVRE